MRTRVLGLVVAGAAVLSVGALSASASATSTAATPTVKRNMGSCSSRGDFALCEPKGATLNKPVSIEAGIWAAPRQGITGNWTMVCTRGTSAGGKSGTFKGRTTVHVFFKFPFAHPDSCTEAVLAELNGSGRIHIWVTGKRVAPGSSAAPTAAPSPTSFDGRPAGVGVQAGQVPCWLAERRVWDSNPR